MRCSGVLFSEVRNSLHFTSTCSHLFINLLVSSSVTVFSKAELIESFAKTHLQKSHCSPNFSIILLWFSVFSFFFEIIFISFISGLTLSFFTNCFSVLVELVFDFFQSMKNI
jgi:hypothetical protein